LRQLEKEEDVEDSSRAIGVDSEKEITTVDDETKITTPNNTAVGEIEVTSTSNDLTKISLLRELEKEEDAEDNSNAVGVDLEEENTSVNEETKITTSNTAVDEIRSSSTYDTFTGFSILRQLEKEENVEDSSRTIGVDLEEESTVADEETKITTPSTAVDEFETTVTSSDNLTGITLLRQLEKEEDTEDSLKVIGVDSEEENTTVGDETKITTPNNSAVDEIETTSTSKNLTGISSLRHLEKEEDAEDSSNAGCVKPEEENTAVDKETKITTFNTAVNEIEITAISNNLAGIPLLHRLGEEDTKANSRAISVDSEEEDTTVVDEIENTTFSNNLTGISSLHQLEKEEDAEDSSNAVGADLEEENTAVAKETKITTFNTAVDEIEITAISNNLTKISLLHQLGNEEDTRDNSRDSEEDAAANERNKITTPSTTVDKLENTVTFSNNLTGITLLRQLEKEEDVEDSSRAIGVDSEKEITTVDDETKITTPNNTAVGEIEVTSTSNDLTKISLLRELEKEEDGVEKSRVVCVEDDIWFDAEEESTAVDVKSEITTSNTSSGVFVLGQVQVDEIYSEDCSPADFRDDANQRSISPTPVIQKLVGGILENSSIANRLNDDDQRPLRTLMVPNFLEKCVEKIEPTNLNFLDDIVEANSEIGSTLGESIDGETQSIGSETQSIGDETQTCNNDSVYNLTPILQLEKRFIRLVKKKKWSAVEEFFNLNHFDRRPIASRKPLFCGDDYPLHLICDYNARIKERMRILKELEKEKKIDEDKKKARYDRIRRRRHGENVDTIYDSDEWTSSDEESDLSDDNGLDKKTSITRGSNVQKIKEMLPPTSLILALLKAYPQAAKSKGYNARLPLHHIMRHNYPPDVIEAMILAYPHALNIKDNMNQTPRDIMNIRLDCAGRRWDSEIHTVASKTNSIDEGVEVSLSTKNGGSGTEVEINDVRQNSRTYTSDINMFLDCPVSCWIEHSKNLKHQTKIESKINDLQGEVDILQDTLVDINEECTYINGTIDDLTKRVEDFLVTSIESVQMNEQIEILEMTLGPEFEKLNTSLGVAESWDVDTYHQTEEHTKYIRAFNEDINIVYEKMNSDMATIKEDIKSLNLCISEGKGIHET